MHNCSIWISTSFLRLSTYTLLRTPKNVLFGLLIEYALDNGAKMSPQEETIPALRVILSVSVLNQFMTSTYDVAPCAQTS